MLRRLNPVPYIKQRIANAYNRKVENVKSRLDQIALPARLQGTPVEKLLRYFKHLIIDYSEVFWGVAKEAKAKPVKAMIYAGTGTTIYHCAIRNTSEEDFLEQLRFYANEIGSLPETMQNPVSRNHIISIERLYAQGTMRRLNIGVASIFWRHDHNPELQTYKANCSYVGPDWLAFRERIVDVGFLDRFWVLEKRMKDYDVNNN